ncbi:DnaD domain protein [Carboxydochorda subterranea]|uniref:DnaD domain protein n=1 Tax=Carboxydichorda subterranea TaxID=3109565 RepID=A0ABZ1BX65_9FIRM|nr:DnaD domain protein [Limnochorda sp. L945t]WRP17075.1 DnaD domain protein [Limnochorda sp. L945t]
MGRRRLRIEPAPTARRYLPVPEELLTLYAPRMGWQAVSAWLVLRFAAEHGGTPDDEDPASYLARSLGMPPLEAAEALRTLGLYRLVEPVSGQGLRVHEPLPGAEFARQFGPPPDGAGHPSPETDGARQEAAASAESAHAPEAAPPEGGAGYEPNGESALPTDVRGVLDWYHQRIGLISDTQAQRLGEWITERHMATDVVALAIEQTARSAEFASFSYLEGVLRNWYNQGVRTWEDVLRRPSLASVIHAPARGGQAAGPGAPATSPAPGGRAGADRSDAPMTGVPNAEAYRPVDPERIRRWKELYGRGH